jgi:hypothetical protein
VLRRGDGSVFAPSLTSYLDALPGRLQSRDAKVYLRIAVGSPFVTTTALLDTGATYSVLDADMAKRVGAFEESSAPRVSLSTRFGDFPGSLIRRSVRILALQGPSIDVDATFWASPE